MFSQNRRQVLLSLIALTATGCSHSPLLQSFSNSVRAYHRKSPDAKVTRADVERLPYASIGTRIGDGGLAMVVLARKEGADLTWISADHINFVTRAGRLVKTAGLPRDLAATRTTSQDPVALGLNTVKNGTTYTRYIDLAPGDYKDVACVSTFSVEGRESITILERSYDTVRVMEKMSVSRWQWDVQNTYWADAQTGFVWKSVQQFSPDIPPIQIEIFKPAA